MDTNKDITLTLYKVYTGCYMYVTSSVYLHDIQASMHRRGRKILTRVASLEWKLSGMMMRGAEMSQWMAHLFTWVCGARRSMHLIWEENYKFKTSGVRSVTITVQNGKTHKHCIRPSFTVSPTQSEEFFLVHPLLRVLNSFPSWRGFNDWQFWACWLGV